MVDTFIPVNTPCLDGNEKKYLAECIDSGWISSEGPFVRRFEEGMAASTRRQSGIAVSNGSIALEIAVRALEIGPGDEVICPTFTIISCAAAIVRAGAVPVLVDCDPVTWNMKVEDVASQITPGTRAIMVAHTYGLPVDMDPMLELARQHDLLIIEDAAEAHGQSYRGRPCGSFGDISTFSFYPNKHVTTGEGGMIVTDDPHLADRCRALRNLGFQAKRFVHNELGWNARMSNLQAAVGVAQLERLPEVIDRKRRMGRDYSDLLRAVDGIQTPAPETDFAVNHYWVYGIVLDNAIPFDAEVAMNRLAAYGIGTRPFFWPIHEQPVFRSMGLFADESHPVAERLARRGLYLPSGVSLSESDRRRVAKALKTVVASG